MSLLDSLHTLSGLPDLRFNGSVSEYSCKCWFKKMVSKSARAERSSIIKHHSQITSFLTWPCSLDLWFISVPLANFLTPIILTLCHTFVTLPFLFTFVLFSHLSTYLVPFSLPLPNTPLHWLNVLNQTSYPDPMFLSWSYFLVPFSWTVHVFLTFPLLSSYCMFSFLPFLPDSSKTPLTGRDLGRTQSKFSWSF